MEIEQKQAQMIEHFVKQASSLQGSSLVSLIVQVTSHSSLFAFSEILAVPSVLEVSLTCIYLFIYCSQFPLFGFNCYLLCLIQFGCWQQFMLLPLLIWILLVPCFIAFGYFQIIDLFNFWSCVPIWVLCAVINVGLI